MSAYRIKLVSSAIINAGPLHDNLRGEECEGNVDVSMGCLVACQAANSCIPCVHLNAVFVTRQV